MELLDAPIPSIRSRSSSVLLIRRLRLQCQPAELLLVQRCDTPRSSKRYSVPASESVRPFLQRHRCNLKPTQSLLRKAQTLSFAGSKLEETTKKLPSIPAVVGKAHHHGGTSTCRNNNVAPRCRELQYGTMRESQESIELATQSTTASAEYHQQGYKVKT